MAKSKRPPPPPEPPTSPTIPMRYTSFTPYPTFNAKNVAASYIKGDVQSWWWRRAERERNSRIRFAEWEMEVERRKKMGVKGKGKDKDRDRGGETLRGEEDEELVDESLDAWWEEEKKRKRRRLAGWGDDDKPLILPEDDNSAASINAGSSSNNFNSNNNNKPSVLLTGTPTRTKSRTSIPPGPSKRASLYATMTEIPEGSSLDPNSKTIVIHPGSKSLRIGKASDSYPITVPNVIARRRKKNMDGDGKVERLCCEGEFAKVKFRKLENNEEEEEDQNQGQNSNGNKSSSPQNVDIPEGHYLSSNPQQDDDTSFESKISPLRQTLRTRMRALKLRGQSNAQSLAAQHNENVCLGYNNNNIGKEVIGEINDFDRMEWTGGDVTTATDDVEGDKVLKDCYVGEKALYLAEPSKFILRRPISYSLTLPSTSFSKTNNPNPITTSNPSITTDPTESEYQEAVRHPKRPGARFTMFNTWGYESGEELKGDMKDLWNESLEEGLGVDVDDLQDYSAILIIPDLFDSVYIREMTDFVLRTMGFKQILLQQESLCSTFGAGLSTATVVDIGAQKISIGCVDEGIVMSDSRQCLAFGGDDITEFFLQLLARIYFPYREIDLNRGYDLQMMEGLKEKVCTLNENGFGLNMYEFYARQYKKATIKYTIKVYEDAIIAPMALFAPRVIDFERKFSKAEGRPKLWMGEEGVDDVVDMGANVVTNAMKNCVRHLILHPPNLTIQDDQTSTSGDPSRSQTPLPMSGLINNNNDFLHPNTTTPSGSHSHTAGTPQPPGTPSGGGGGTKPPTRVPSPTGQPIINGLGSGTTNPNQPGGVQHPPASYSNGPILKTGTSITEEASKIPLDVAVCESICAASLTEGVAKRLTQAILVVGGGGLIPGIGAALGSRLLALLQQRFPTLTQVSVVPPPREIDPRILAWKGVAVLSRLDSAQELWVRREDWEAMGLRALKDRNFFF